jgi:hypothetical protein
MTAASDPQISVERGWRRVRDRLRTALLTPVRAMRLRYLPLLMIYYAYGALGLVTIAETFWIKEALTTSQLRLGLCRRILESPLRHLEQIGDHRMLASLTNDVAMVSQAMNGIPTLGINLVILVCGAIYLGSLSKVFSPGMRLGYYIAPSPFQELMTTTRQAVDVHANHLAQAAAAEFISGGYLAAHLPSVVALYRSRLETMLDTLAERLPPAREPVPAA